MSSIFIISSSVKRCTLQLLRATHARGFASELSGRRVQDDSHPTFGGIVKQPNLPPIIHSAYSANQTHNWDNEFTEFKYTWNEVLHEITGTGKFQMFPEIMPKITKMLNYTVPTGHQRRYCALLYAYKNLAPADQLTEENLRLARILGWSTEMVFAGFTVLDDMIDNADTRRRGRAWFVNDGVGTMAALDAVCLIHLPYELMKRYFRKKVYYTKVVELFTELSLKVPFGVMSEWVGKNDETPDLEYYTSDLYHRVILFKTVPIITAPIHLAMYHAGIMDPELFRLTAIILVELARYYQIQNDYLDCYGNDPDYKSERDIVEGSVTWTITVALERATPAQKKILKEHYGKNNPESVAAVKQVFADVGIPSLFVEYRQRSFDLINTYIQELPNDFPHHVFFTYRDNIFETEPQKKAQINLNNAVE